MFIEHDFSLEPVCENISVENNDVVLSFAVRYDMLSIRLTKEQAQDVLEMLKLCEEEEGLL